MTKTGKAAHTSYLLIHEAPLQVLPSLAVALGLTEAMLLQQLHFLLQVKPNMRDGLPWHYNSYKQWQEIFPFWSESTIKRALLHLETLGIIRSANYNTNPIDKTKWYTIAYQQLNDFASPSTGQNEPSTGQNEPSTGQNEPSTGQNEPSTGQNEPTPRDLLRRLTPSDNPPISSPPTEEPSLPSLTPDWLMVLYNEATPPEHPKVRTLSPARREKAAKYVRIFPDIAFWQTVMQEVTDSAFLLGRKPSEGHEGFVADFDWLLTKGKDGTENCLKVAEGKYRDGPLDGFSPAQRRTILAAQRTWHKEHDGDAAGAVSDVFDVARNARRRLRGPSGGDPPEGVLGTDA